VTDIRRVDGILISTDDARTLAEALRQFGAVLAHQGSRLTARMERLRAQLITASDVSTGVSVRPSVPEQGSVPSLTNDTIGATEAARLLGCSPGNVRDLARRGALPAHRTGGRWIFDAHTVRMRAKNAAA